MHASLSMYLVFVVNAKVPTNYEHVFACTKHHYLFRTVLSQTALNTKFPQANILCSRIDFLFLSRTARKLNGKVIGSQPAQ